MPETPTLYVYQGDEGGPRIHPCRRVQEDLREAGIAYETDKLPTLKVPNGTVISHSLAILRWIKDQG